ncbi:MAG: tetratricopeptide repeat protein [Bacteroidetes bacterium]|nr:tetratricopeptide repeat protein [Bacteroidota bacterium]
MGKSKLTGLFGIILYCAFCFKGSGQTNVIDSLKDRLNVTDGEEKIRTLVGLSYNYLRISADTSLMFANRALEYSDETGNERGRARAFLMIGSSFSTLGDNTQAIKNHLTALGLFESLKDTAAIGISYNELGIDYHNAGKYSEAIDQYKNSLIIAERQANKDAIYYATNNIGTIYEDWGKYQLALEYYLACLNLAYELDDQSYIGISLQNAGVASQKLGKYTEALDFLEKSLEVSQRIGDRKGIFNTYINEGEIFLKLDEIQKAIENFELAMESAMESENKANIALADLKLGESYCLAGQHQRAEPYLRYALSLAKETGETNLIKDAHKALADYYVITGDYKKAYQSFVDYTTIRDTIYNRESRREITEMQTLYELDKKEKEIEIQDLKIGRQKAQFYYIISGVFVLVILALLLFNRYKLKQKHFRTELEKKNIDIEQRLLRTQMNPHFIFNSLNSINGYIALNDPDSAQSYLTKFARLMRYILENSRKAFVPVEDEVNTLKLNMELEQLRYDNRFGFEIKVDETIDTESTFIPPMLIQPFIENAIIHGLANKQAGGKLFVEMKREGELIHCTIEDNGIGREKAMAIKEKSGKAKHRSLGMQVTKERLDILNEKSKEKIAFQISDLKDETGNAAGTKVDLKIPFEVE